MNKSIVNLKRQNSLRVKTDVKHTEEDEEIERVISEFFGPLDLNTPALGKKKPSLL